MPIPQNVIIAAAFYHEHHQTGALLSTNPLSVKQLLDDIKSCLNMTIQTALSEKISTYQEVYQNSKNKKKTNVGLLDNESYSESSDLKPLFFAQFEIEAKSSSWRNMFSRTSSCDLLGQYAALFHDDNLSRQAVTCLIFQELPCFSKEVPRELGKLIDEFRSVIQLNDDEKLQHAKNVLDVLPWKDSLEFCDIKTTLDEPLQTINAAKIAKSAKKGPSSLTNAPVVPIQEEIVVNVLTIIQRTLFGPNTRADMNSSRVAASGITHDLHQQKVNEYDEEGAENAQDSLKKSLI